MKIDCPECGGSGYIAEYPEYNIEIDDVPKCPDCKDGKITVYTQAELDEEIGEYANTKLYQSGYQSGVKAEREACANECVDIQIEYGFSESRDYENIAQGARECAEAIRNRNKE